MAPFPLPYGDIDLTRDKLQRVIERDHSVEFSHTPATQIGGLLKAGFLFPDPFEDKDQGAAETGRSRS